MKQNHINRFLPLRSRLRAITGPAALIVLIAATAACSRGDELSPTPGGEASGLLTVTVSDGGYAAADGTPGTRTVENGYQTHFQAGDCIGVFVERTTDGGVTHTCENVKLIYDGAAWTGPLYYYTAEGSRSVTYTAYYPYRDAGFADGAAFDAWVNGFTPSTDQSTHALYTAADLMTATGAVTDGNSISFRLVHRMALCVVELPVTKYTLTDVSGNSLPDYYIPVPGIQFNSFNPYNHVNGEYRYLVKPGTATPLSGSYRDDAGDTKEYTLDISAIPAATYKCYKVDGATVTTKTHTLQAGDYYMKDGSLVAGTAPLPDSRKADVAGIVFWAGDPTNTTSGDPALRREYPHCNHGLVVALKDASAGTHWQTAWSDIGSWMNANPTGYENIATGIGDTDNLQKIIGYNNTRVISLYNEYCDSQGGMDDNKVLPLQYIEAYARNNPAPAGSSGWYLPSPKELSTLCSGWYDGNIWYIRNAVTNLFVNRDLINGRLSALGASVAEQISAAYYWSGSERTEYPNYACRLSFNVGWVSNNSKDNNLNRVRPVLAF